MNLANLKIGLFLGLAIFLVNDTKGQNCTCQIKNYKQEQVEFVEFPFYDSVSIATRDIKRDTAFLFFNYPLDDTLLICQSGKELGRLEVLEKNHTKISTDYSGIMFRLSTKKRDPIIIFFLNKKRYLKFRISNKYSFYTVQWMNNIWYFTMTNSSTRDK